MDSYQQPSVNPWLVTFSVMLATFMEILDTTVVNVSLAHIAGNLAATVDEGTWVVTSYLVSNAIVLPMAGWLARRFGRRNMLLVCTAGFTGASICCGAATTLPWLIFFRILQGLAGGGMAAAVAIGVAGDLPAREARSGDGCIRHRHYSGANHRPDTRRLDHR